MSYCDFSRIALALQIADVKVILRRRSQCILDDVFVHLVHLESHTADRDILVAAIDEAKIQQGGQFICRGCDDDIRDFESGRLKRWTRRLYIWILDAVAGVG